MGSEPQKPERFGFPVQAVLLDAAGTLIRPRESVGATYAAAARRFGAELDPDELSQTFFQVLGDMPDLAFAWSSMEELYRLERDWWRDLVRRVLDLTGSRIGDFDGFFEKLLHYYAQGEAWECFPDAPPALRALRTRGCRLAVVSNFDSRLPGILRVLGIWNHMDAIVYSSEAGSAKPDPAIFRRALAVLDVTPGQAIHVGDSAEADLGGAVAAGIEGLLIRRGDAPAIGSETVIRSLEELPSRIGYGGR